LKIDNSIYNSKLSILAIPRMYFYKRPTVVLRKENNNYFYYNNFTEEIWNPSMANELTLYVIVSKEDNNYKVIDYMQLKDSNFISTLSQNVNIKDYEKSLFNI
jgi:hypothetical protein